MGAIFIGIMMAFMLMNLRPYGHYAMIIFPAMPILFAVICESRNELQQIWRTSGLSLKRILLKTLIVISVIDICMSSCCIKELCLNEKSTLLLFAPTVNRKIVEYLNPNEHEEILKLRSLIPDDEKKSFVCWGDYCTTTHWVIRTDMKPREKFFMNNSHLVSIDPEMRKEWFDNIRKDYPLWILYGTDPNRKPGEPPETSPEDSELEQLLEEKYSLKGEVFIFPQVMKLYRLKE